VDHVVGRCRLTAAKAVFRVHMVSALETIMWMRWFQLLLSNSTCAATMRVPKSAEIFRRQPPVCINGDTEAYYRQGLTLVHYLAQRKPICGNTLGA